MFSVAGARWCHNKIYNKFTLGKTLQRISVEQTTNRSCLLIVLWLYRRLISSSILVAFKKKLFIPLLNRSWLNGKFPQLPYVASCLFESIKSTNFRC